MDLAAIKSAYAVFEKKYGLPEFKAVNEQFELEKIEQESECFLRVVRKVMMDKVVNSLGFFDMLLNPVNAPRIYLSFIKSMNMEEKASIDKLYNEFGELSLACLALELEYREESEAEMIRRVFTSWNAVKPEFAALLTKIHKPLVTSSKRERSYFG